ncbi:dTDP-4-amino-4,6-dideoxygalactose transaminase [compost metagenome]
MAAFSFHETKNYTSGGEGGLLLINDSAFVARAEIIREKGTNRSQFFRGMVDKYTWVDVGSSYLPGELQAAYLFGQLEKADEINTARLSTWNKYYAGLLPFAKEGYFELPQANPDCASNGHMFYLKLSDIEHRTAVLESLKKAGVGAVFHYIPLHSAPAGRNLGRFNGVDKFTTLESERLIRLPIWLGITEEEVDHVIEAVIGAVNAAK